MKPEEPVILMGDFNLSTKENYDKIPTEGGFKSSYLEANGKEPEFTFPTGLKADTMVPEDPCTLDFIFYRGTT